MKTVQLAFGRSIYQSVSAGRRSASALAAPKKAKEPKIPILFGSHQAAQTTATAVDETVAGSGINHSSMVATGLLVAGAAVGLGAIMGLLFLLPIGLMLAAAGGALFMSNNQTKPAPPKSTDTGQQKKVFQVPIFEKVPFTGTLKERTSQGAVVLLSSFEDEREADEPTALGSLSSIPLPTSDESAEQAKPSLSASVSRGKENSIPGGLSPFEFPAQNSHQAIASSEKPAAPPVIKESDLPQPPQVLLRSAGDWRQYPVKLNNHTIGYPKSRFIRAFSGIEELNEELKLAPNNNNFAGVTLYQVAFNNINFPPNTDFRQLKVEKAVAFENCKLPGASFEGIQGTGKITFINTDLADATYDPADSHFIIRNSDARLGAAVN